MIKMLVFRYLITGTLLYLAIPCSASGDISLPKIFSDHMVVQRNSNLRIWGTAEPNENLTVRFGKQSVVAVANPAGKWVTFVKTGPAGGPYELEVASKDRGGAKVLVTDILVGDIWLCGGQTNMETPISELENADQEITDARNFPLIRLFKVQHHQANQPLHDFADVNPWLCCSSDSIKSFSAIGFLFGKKLNQEINVPIGLIDVSREGITLEAWTPYKDLESNGQFSEMLNHWNEIDSPNSPIAPGQSFNGMVAPLTGFPMAGIVWIQGEANVGRGAQYAKMFPLMINSWRSRLGPKIPFLFAQLAPFRYENFTVEALPEIWDAQLKTFKSVSRTGMVVASDLADLQSIDIKNKEVLATRLAAWALASASKKTNSAKKPEPANSSRSRDTNVNAKPNSADQPHTSEVKTSAPATTTNMKQHSGPIFQSFETMGNEIVVSFRFADGLTIKGNDKSSFVVCGEDKKFVPAVARVEGSKLIISSPDIANPIAARYAWHDTALPSLTNSEGLPASPFRTDDFRLTSAGVNF